QTELECTPNKTGGGHYNPIIFDITPFARGAAHERCVVTGTDTGRNAERDYLDVRSTLHSNGNPTYCVGNFVGLPPWKLRSRNGYSPNGRSVLVNIVPSRRSAHSRGNCAEYERRHGSPARHARPPPRDPGGSGGPAPSNAGGGLRNRSTPARRERAVRRHCPRPRRPTPCSPAARTQRS